MGRGRKMKISAISPIMSVMCSGAAHEVQRASYDVVEVSYASQVLTCTSGRAQGCNTQRGSPSMRERFEGVRTHQCKELRACVRFSARSMKASTRIFCWGCVDVGST